MYNCIVLWAVGMGCGNAAFGFSHARLIKKGKSLHVWFFTSWTRGIASWFPKVGEKHIDSSLLRPSNKRSSLMIWWVTQCWALHALGPCNGHLSCWSDFLMPCSPLILRCASGLPAHYWLSSVRLWSRMAMGWESTIAKFDPFNCSLKIKVPLLCRGATES